MHLVLCAWANPSLTTFFTQVITVNMNKLYNPVNGGEDGTEDDFNPCHVFAKGVLGY